MKTKTVKVCNIDRGRFCKALAMALDHEKNVATSQHFPTMANVVLYDFGKKGYLTFVLCPFCGTDLVAKKIKRWREKRAQQRANATVKAIRKNKAA